MSEFGQYQPPIESQTSPELINQPILVNTVQEAVNYFSQGQFTFDKVCYVKYEPLEKQRCILTSINVEAELGTSVLGNRFMDALVDAQMPDMIVALSMNKDSLKALPVEIVDRAA